MGGILRPDPPANLPGAYEDLKDNRLLHNPNITRMPTTQREWNAFIQELNKWIKNETGNFDVGSGEDATFTEGFSADPSTANIWWHRYGQIVHMEFDINIGTSGGGNANRLWIGGIPEKLRPKDPVLVTVSGVLHDNGTDLTALSSCIVGSDGTLKFFPDHNGGLWTTSGAKGFASLTTNQSIIYPLRQPSKH